MSRICENGCPPGHIFDANRTNVCWPTTYGPGFCNGDTYNTQSYLISRNPERYETMYSCVVDGHQAYGRERETPNAVCSTPAPAPVTPPPVTPPPVTPPPVPAPAASFRDAPVSIHTPAPAPAPTVQQRVDLVCEYCKCPRGSGRVDPGCPVQNMACIPCPEDVPPQLEWLPIAIVGLLVILILAALFFMATRPKINQKIAS
jgi:hypothetical protein